MIENSKFGEEFVVVCGEDQSGRIDVVLTKLLADVQGSPYSRAKIQKYLESGAVRINDDVIIKSSYKVSGGDEITIFLTTEQGCELEPDSSVKFDVVYEDESVLVVNKPAGVVVHPGAGKEKGTLAAGLLARYGSKFLEVGHPLRPGIVHRLDKETSGLMVIAKTQQAYYALSSQFLPPRTIKRKYYALTMRLPRSAGVVAHEGVIEFPISRHPHIRTKMTAKRQEGRAAVTHWHLAEGYGNGFLIELELETGRTHQIRAHLEALNAPIIADELYGFRVENVDSGLKKAIKDLGRVALHAKSLSFKHPNEEKMMEFQAELPEDMQRLIEVLKKH